MDNPLLPELVDGPGDATATLLLAHGAGAGMEHEFMTAVAEGLAAVGVRVVRFEFPYMAKRRVDGKKRPPDRMPKLLEAYRQVVQRYAGTGPLFIGGKSMGGRVASLLAVAPDDELAVDGVVCLGFPFHPPGKPERYRGEHLVELPVPALIVQGERDPFGTRAEVESYRLGSRVICEFVTDGEHSFKPRKASGVSLNDNLEQAVRLIAAFMGECSKT